MNKLLLALALIVINNTNCAAEMEQKTAKVNAVNLTQGEPSSKGFFKYDKTYLHTMIVK